MTTTKKESLSNLIFGSSTETSNLFKESPSSSPLKRKIDHVDDNNEDKSDDNSENDKVNSDDESTSSNASSSSKSEPDDEDNSIKDETGPIQDENKEEPEDEDNSIKEGDDLPSTTKDQNKTIETEEEQNTRTIFVGNLPPTATRKSLSKIFKQCGKIQTTRLRSQATTSVKLPPEQAGKQKLMKKICANKHLIDGSVKRNAQGYVVFESADSVEVALEMNNLAIKDVDENGKEQEYTIRVDTVPPTINNDLSIFIGNLTYKVQEQNLRNYFQDKCGDSIQNVRIIRDNKTMQCKGVGYILFKNYGGVKKALRLHGTSFEGRELRVMRCKKSNKRQRNDSQEQPTGVLRRLQEKKKVLDFSEKKNVTKKKSLVRRKTTHSKYKKHQQRPNGVTKRAAKQKKVKDAMKKVEKRFKKQERRGTKKSFL